LHASEILLRGDRSRTEDLHFLNGNGAGSNEIIVAAPIARGLHGTLFRGADFAFRRTHVRIRQSLFRREAGSGPSGEGMPGGRAVRRGGEDVEEGAQRVGCAHGGGVIVRESGVQD
jgi:hypothetical protein